MLTDAGKCPPGLCAERPFSQAFFAAAPALAAEEAEEQVQLCAACHGENGIPQEKTTPIIWGQTLGYQYLQLRDYKNGDRKHELMATVVEQLEKADLLPLAEYFSKKPWPPTWPSPHAMRSPSKQRVPTSRLAAPAAIRPNTRGRGLSRGWPANR
jgi:cytochrome c553